MQPMVLVYLPTKLGDFFGQGQMLVNIPAPWSIWVWDYTFYKWGYKML